MHITPNPYLETGLTHPDLDPVPMPSVDAAAAQALLSRCPHAAVTPLQTAPDLAQQLGIAAVSIKDERTRMGLGSFKALGAAYVIACDHAAGRAAGQHYVTASAGNHGLSLAAGAAAFGARAAVFIADPVPESFADRLRDIGADVHRAGATYEDSMAAAVDFAKLQNATLLSDSSWVGYTSLPHRLMEGYTALMAETFDQIATPPTHIFLQAGVGGLAGAAAAMARMQWGTAPHIVVVEPEAAPALVASIRSGAPIVTEGPVSAMGRLDCKEPSLIALKGLARDADSFMTITEEEGTTGATISAQIGFETTPSGGAGLAGLLAGRDAAELGLSADAHVLLIFSEEALA